MPDHDVLFRQLRSKIVASVTPHVAKLQSETCSTGEAINSWKLQQILNFCRNEGCMEGNTLATNSNSGNGGERMQLPTHAYIYKSRRVCLRMRKLH